MKTIIKIFIPIVLLLSCSPKTIAPEVTSPEAPKQEPTKMQPENDCTTFSQLSGNKRDEVETAYVLYKDLAKQQKYKEALPLWETAYYGAPASNGRVKYQFDDGVAIYTYLHSIEKDEAIKKSYIDSVMSIYDKRIECFGGEAYIKGRKAFDYYYTFPGIKSDADIYEMFKLNFDVNGKKADYFVVNPFTKLLSDRIISGEVSHEEGRKYAKLINKAVDYGTANCKTTYCDAWKIISEYAPQRLENFEGIDGFYGCDYYANKYYSRFENAPTDCAIIGLVGRRLKRGGCTADDPRLIAVTSAYNTHCKKKVEKPTSSALRLAYDCYQNGDYTCAITNFDAHVKSTTDSEKKAKYALLIAKIYYGDVKNFPKARKYALEAASYKPNWGDPFMLIGKLYASSGPLCGSGRGWNSQVVTWPAIDKFIHAKSIDASVSSEANKLITQYRKYMPKKADIFQRTIKAGSSFKVPCWIQETTKVRTAD
ncbi:MAG: hypothetical protein V3V14_05520 [Saprospiraceae bacterium]